MKNSGAHRNKDRGHYIEKIGMVPYAVICTKYLWKLYLHFYPLIAGLFNGDGWQQLKQGHHAVIMIHKQLFQPSHSGEPSQKIGFADRLKSRFLKKGFCGQC